MKKWKISTKKGYSEVIADGVNYLENYCVLYKKNENIHDTVAVFPIESLDSIIEAESEGSDSDLKSM